MNKFRLLFTLPFLLFSSISLCALETNQINTEEKTLSINAENQPLGELLEIIYIETGCLISLTNESWLTFPVSVNINNAKLKQALNKILTNFNYVTVNENDKNITINISSATVSPDHILIPKNVNSDSSNIPIQSQIKIPIPPESLKTNAIEKTQRQELTNEDIENRRSQLQEAAKNLYEQIKEN